MSTLKRQSLLYKTGVEYGDYAINIAEGCSHGCKYPCYAYLMAKRFDKIKSYEEWCEPKLVSNALKLLDEEIPKLKDKIRSVQLCFTTDPFMYNHPETSVLSLAIIRKLNESNIKCSVLTKGILPLELATLSRENEYGITLVSLDEEFRAKMEPNTAPYIDRINALRALHEAGYRTWVSIEPYPTPNIINQDLYPILDAISFVDKIIFGRLNYNKEVSAYKDSKLFFNKCANQVIEYCKTYNKQCHIKSKTITTDV